MIELLRFRLEATGSSPKLFSTRHFGLARASPLLAVHGPLFCFERGLDNVHA